MLMVMMIILIIIILIVVMMLTNLLSSRRLQPSVPTHSIATAVFPVEKLVLVSLDNLFGAYF